MKVKKLLVMLLAVLVMISALPMTVFASYDYAHNESTSSDGYYNIISKNDWDIAPGIKESEIVLNNDAGNMRQVIHLMEADISNPYTRVISSYTNMDTSKYAISTIPDHAAYIENVWGENVVGAMNTCLSWYNSGAYAQDPSRVNEPLGFMMVDGEVYFDHSVGFPTCIVIHKDVNDKGEARPNSIPKVEMRTVKTVDDLNGWEDQVIPSSSGFIVKDGINQAKPSHANDMAARSVVGVKADGSIVIMMNDGRQAPFSAGMNMYECAEVMIAAGCVYASNCDGGGSSTFMSQRPGRELEVNCSPCDGALRQNTHGIMIISTAPATGEFDNAYLTTENDYYVPYSSVKVDAIGRDFSGAEADIPAEASWSLSDDSFGEIVNGVFTSNGKIGNVEINLNYNGNVVGSKTINIVHPESISFTQNTTVIPYGKSTSLDIVAKYGAFDVYYDFNDFIWVSSDETAGVIDGLIFNATSDTTKNGLKITATYKYAEMESATLDITFGKGSEILYDFEDGDISNWLGKDKLPEWAKINNPDSPIFDASPFGANFSIGTESSVFLATSENGKVKNGNNALGVELDYTHSGSFGQWTYNMFFNVEGQTVLRDTANGKNATRLGMWIYIPEELAPGNSFAMQTELYCGSSSTNYARKNTHLILECNGQTLAKCTEADIPEDRWVYCYMDLTPYNYVSLQNPFKSTTARREPQFIRFYTQSKEPFKSLIYIDDITLDYSNAVDDRNAPVISDLLVNTSGTTIRSFNAKIADFAANNTSGLNYNSGKIYVDGVLLDGVTASGTTLSSPDVTLSSGNHTVTFEISDNKGNTTKESLNFKVDGVAPIIVTGHNDLNNTPEYDSVYYVDINANNIETIDSLTTDIYLNFSNTWELEHMMVSNGFEASYTLDPNTNVATITVNNVDNTKTGSAALVSIPVRVWSWDAEGAGFESSEIAANNYPLVYIKTDVRKGEAALVDGTQITFNGGSTLDTAILSSVIASNWHTHTAENLTDVEATCTSGGYTNRTYCYVCGSIVEWGTTLDATGHNWELNADGKLVCTNNNEFFNGIYTDGKEYIDGVVATDGWNADNTAYYVDGVKLTGSHFLDGTMYTFDENGTYLADYKYNGFYEINDTIMYFENNEFKTGCQWIETVFYNFDKNGMGYDGEVELCGTICNFEDGQFVETEGVLLAGTCGDNVYYVIYTDGRLVLDGTGEMMDFLSLGMNPWWRQEFRMKVKKIVIGNGITRIGERAFVNTYATEVVFEEGSKLVEISRNAFAVMDKLVTVTLPEGVRTLGPRAFYDCSKLTDVYLPSTVTQFVSNPFDKSPNAILHVAKGSPVITKIESLKLNYVTYAVALEKGSCGDDVEWALYNDGSLKITGVGAMTDYEAGKAPWYNKRRSITSVEIGDKITTIGKFSFYNCINLDEVVFAKNGILTVIGWGSFGATGLEEITIPASVKIMNDYALYNNASLEAVKFEEGSKLHTIGRYAFRNAPNLKSVFIPDGVTSIGANAFLDTTSVTVSVAEGSYAHNYAVSSKIAYTTREPMPFVKYSGNCGTSAEWELYSNGVLKIFGSGAMTEYDAATAPWYKYRKEITTVEISENITTIGKFSFYGCDRLENVIFAKNGKLTTIGWGSFGLTGLKEITIPATVKTINDYAFYNNASLETVKFESGSKVNTLGRCVFRNVPNLKSVFIPDGVTSIGTNAFLSTTSVTLSVAENSFAHNYAVKNKMSFVTREPLPFVKYSGECGNNAEWELYSDGILVINGSGEMAAYDATTAPWYKYRNDITTVEIGKDITAIGKFSFYGCSNLKTVVFAEDGALETIGWGSFGYSGLEEITIPATVKKLDRYSFYYCGELNTVNFASNSQLTFIDSYAFRATTALESVNGIPATAKLSAYAFYQSAYSIN